MNDLLYNEIVATTGYELEFAVGTTYSLDPEIFLALSLAFSRMGEINDTDFQNPMRLLEGLRQATGKIALFCNRGGMQPPARKNPLNAILDRCVFEVTDKNEPLANFHPKLWIIKERSIEHPEEHQIKLVVLSRNLTNDTSLDIAASMTAPIGSTPSAATRRKHQPLVSLLEELAKFANPKKRKKIKGLIKDFERLGRFKLDGEYVDYDFLPFHFGRNLNDEIDFRKELPGQKMVIVSPFIDRTETVMINGKTEDVPLKWMLDHAPGMGKVLITRLESLTPEIMQLFSGSNREVWVMSQLAEQNDIQPMNLHAKMYFSRNPRNGGTYLWLGSANATHSGFYRNSEFLLRLALRRGKHQFEKFKDEFCDEKKQLCQLIDTLPEGLEPSTENHTLAVKVRKHLIAPNNLSATVAQKDNKYYIIVTAKRIKDIPATIRIAPMQEPFNEAELNPATKQCEIAVSDAASLSEFYIVRITPFEGNDCEEIKMVIKIPTEGIPEDRDDRIFRSIVDTGEKFLSYIEMMITDRPLELAALMTGTHADGKMQGRGSNQGISPSLYELLLRTAATNPEKIADIQDFAGRMDKNVVPESFRQMAEMFERCIKKLR